MTSTDPLPGRFGPLLERTRAVVRDVCIPNAARVDRGTAPPRDALRALARAGALGVSTPAEHGGAGAPPAVVRAVVEAVASGCGTTAFVMFQHVVACSHVASSADAALRARFLPAMAAGERFATLAFSHLRRPGPPAVRVRRDGGVLVFDGIAPWCTGVGAADDVLLAGTLPDGDSAWVLVPLVPSTTLHVGDPMELCAANASATVSLALDGHRVAADRQVKTVARAQLDADTARATLFFSSLSLGVATAAVREIRGRAAETEAAELLVAAERLTAEIDAAREAVDAASVALADDGGRERAFAVRAHCIELGVRAAHAAVVAQGGRANLLGNAAQRLFREAMLYTLTAQTRDLQRACVERSVARS